MYKPIIGKILNCGMSCINYIGLYTQMELDDITYTWSIRQVTIELKE